MRTSAVHTLAADERTARTRHRPWARRAALVSIVAMSSAFGVITSNPSPVHAAPIATVPLGLVQTFGVLGPAAVSNAAPTPLTVIRGDVGVGGALTGFPDGIISGTRYEGSVAIGPMMADLQVAYDDARNRLAGTPIVAALDGLTFLPGVHTAAAATGTTAGATVTLDGDQNPDSVFIFQIGGALALGANTTVLLTNGAQAKNVFWQVVGAGSFGANTKFVGTLIATTAVAAEAGSTINGRLTSLTGAIAVSSTQLYAAPPTVSIDGGPTAHTTSSTPLVTGTTSARAPMTVVVRIDGADQPAVTPSTDGTWAFQASLLANGDRLIVARSVDAVGNVGSDSQTLTVDTLPPVVTIDGGAIVATNDVTPTITGTTDIAVGQVVTITSTSTSTGTSSPLVHTALVQTDQSWNVSPNGLAPGEWTIVARVSDPAGNLNFATQTLTIDASAPAAVITSSALTKDPTPTITGTAEAGATIAVSIDGLNVIDIVQGSSWSATTTVALVHGNHNVSVTATDSVGNVTALTQTLTVDVVLPSISITPGTVDSTNDPTPTIIGTTDVADGATVDVTIDGGTALTAFVQAGGWNVTPSATLSPGDHTIVATVADPAGNVGTANQTLTVDVTDPTVLIDGGSSRTTADATPTIAGSSPDAPVGSNVVVTVAGQTLLTTTSADGAYAVTAAAMSNGSHVVLVTVYDAAGNRGDANQSLTINAVAPTVTYTAGPAATTSDATPLIGGTTNAAVGSSVVVQVAGQTLHATVQPGGSWNVTAAALATGSASVVTSITDPDGNVGIAGQTLIIESTTSGPPVVAPPPPAPLVLALPPPTPPVAGPAAGGSQPPEYTSVGPKRVFDTRPGASSNALRQVAERQVGGGYELEVEMTDLAGYVPNEGVGAVSLNVTSTGSAAAGYITVYSCGVREDVSSVNFPAGRTVANAVLAPVSPSGTVCFFADVATDIIVDVNGWFAVGEAFHGVGPKRVFDTRVGASPNALRDVPERKLAADTMLEVRLTDLAGYVPADGVGAVSLNVVVTNPEGYGYITVYSCDTRKVVSSVNYIAGQTVANAVAVPVSATGSVCFYTLATTDLVVDINGWIESGASFHGIGPTRVFDTRTGDGAHVLRAVPAAKIGGENVLQVQVTDLPGYTPSTGVRAVSLNVTVTDPEAQGFITVFDCGTMEEVSSLNYEAGATVANAVLAPVSAAGTICVYSLEPAHVLVDINAWIGTAPTG